MTDNYTDNIISCYTRQDAINDGMFVDVSEVAKEAGVKIPVAITSNLYHSYINPSKMPTGQSKEGRLWDLLNVFAFTARNTQGSFMEFVVKFSNKNVKVWAVIEAQSPTDPSPAINIMLPEDY